MILGDTSPTTATAASLDDLFRRAGVSHPDALALADPPNRADFTDGTPRRLSFGQADRAISAVAAKLRALGLQADSIVAMQLPNTVESVVTFLGVLRAGMIAAPIPLLSRQRDIVSAIGRIGAKAIITSSRIGAADHAEIAMQAAAAVFSVSQVCGYGHDLPDGMVPINDIFTSVQTDFPVAPIRPGPPAAHIAAITFDLDMLPVARSHVELVAGGLETFLEANTAAETTTLSTIPIGSFAGISLTLLHWLLSGGSLHLHHGFNPDVFAAQCREAEGAAVMLPAAAVSAMADACLFDTHHTVVALWRAPERMMSAKAWVGPSVVVDVASFGEIGVIAARRGANNLPTLLPLGAVNAAHRLSGAPIVIETNRNGAGLLALRGRMVPAHHFAPGSESVHAAQLQADGAGYVDTGFPCRSDLKARTLQVTAPLAGTTVVGGYRFRQPDIDAVVAQADPEATIIALPDGDLGQRLAGSAAERAALSAELRARGVNPLISGAFAARGTAEAA